MMKKVYSTQKQTDKHISFDVVCSKLSRLFYISSRQSLRDNQ